MVKPPSPLTLASTLSTIAPMMWNLINKPPSDRAKMIKDSEVNMLLIPPLDKRRLIVLLGVWAT